MTDFTALAHRYLDAFNETDPAKRREVIEQLFTEDVIYTDPLGSVQGWDGVDHFIAGAQGQFAGLVFSLSGEVDGHHDIARFSWHLGPAGRGSGGLPPVEPPQSADEPLAIGFDVVVIADGRISRVLGFLDKIPG